MFDALESRQLMSAALPTGSIKLTGTLIGTAGSYQNAGNTIAKAMDNNTGTFFDAATGANDWVGLDLGTAATITQVQYVPRSGFGSRMVGGVFQGSNTADFSSGVTNLFNVTSGPANTVYTAKPVTVTSSFEFVRYLAPSSGYGNIAELEFDGVPSGAPVLPPPPPAVPTAPIGLSATDVSATAVHLAWQEDPSSVVSSFTIQRQGPIDLNFVTIGTTAGTAATFDDLNTTALTTYAYQVIANNISGPSTAGVSASVTTVAAPVNPWSDSDIGAVAKPGSATLNKNGSMTVVGGGADIWNTADAFNFDSQSMTGNGTIVMQVTAQSNSSTWAKAGIMIRENGSVDARYVLLALTPSNGVTLQARTATHVTPTVSLTTAGKVGVWLEVVRNNSTFSGYVSTDNVNWRLVGSVTISMVNNVLAGMAVTAHNNSTICTATFSNVAITPAGTEASAWSTGATAPIARWESESFTYNNRLYVFGGFIDRNLNATTECDSYNPATNSWSYVTAMPAAITHAAVTVIGDTVYMAGGNIGQFLDKSKGVCTNQVLTYNITSNTWGSITSMPVATASAGMVNVNNHLIYFGGINANNTADVANTWSLDLANQSAGWVAEAAMPNARNHIGYATINGIVYAIGGTHVYKSTTGNDAEVDAYNPITNTWTQQTALPFAWGGIHCTTMVVNNKIVILGGATNGGYDGIYLNNIEEYDPTTNAWTSAGTIPENNQGATDAYINGVLIVVNGTVDNLGGWAQNQTWLDSEIML